MVIKVCVAGATGFVGSLITRRILESKDFQLVGAVARKKAGQDIGEALGLPRTGIRIADSVEEALKVPAEVLIDYTQPQAVKNHALKALDQGTRVVIGTSGLTERDLEEIGQRAESLKLGVITAGNFSLTAALAKHFAQIAAKYLPSWEIIDYADDSKIDAPSGTAQELAETLSRIAQNSLKVPIESIHGFKEARGASVGGSQVHSVRLPGFVFGFEVIFGKEGERLSIRQDSGSSAEIYVQGTLLAAKRVLDVTGLVRGLDTLLFSNATDTKKIT